MDVNSRRVIVILAGLLLAASGIMTSAAVTARAATAAPARQATPMGITSSGRVFNLLKPPSWLKPNTLVHPMQPNSPDTLYGNYQACDQLDQCINNWYGGGAGTLLRFYQEGVANNQWNWWFEGYVDSSWPFTVGAVNNAYTNNVVYKFAAAPNGHGTGNCISQNLWPNSDQLETAGCACSTCQLQTSAKYQYFVIDGNYRYVAVESTNLYVASTHNNSSRVWLGELDGDGNGRFVFQVTDQADSLFFSAVVR